MPEIISDNISIVETNELEHFSRIDAEYYNKPSLINKDGIPAVASVLSGRPE